MTQPQTPENSNAPVLATPETQRERRFKYGANVLLSTIAIILVAALLTYIAQQHSKRFDTTLGGSQTLRPQTISYIKNLKTKIRIVALYPRLKSDSHDQDFYQPVADLLNDYASKNANIQVETFDPDTDKDAFNKLLADVTNNYGGESTEYKKVVEQELPGQIDSLSKFAADEMSRFKELPVDQVQDQNQQQGLYVAYMTLAGIPDPLKRLRLSVSSDLSQRIPSYKDAVDEEHTVMSNTAQLLGVFCQYVESLKSQTALPKAIRDYAVDANTRAAAVGKTVAGIIDRLQHLPALTELDDFRSQLKQKSIIVMTDSGYKILQFDQVWKVPDTAQYGSSTSDVLSRLSFGGEQQISLAIASLTTKQKPLVVFVRPGGPSLVTASEQGQEAIFSAIAQELRDYNFDVLEKDASGQAAQQPDSQNPEATDAQMKSAVWIVVRFPQDSQQGPSPIDAMLEDHLKAGGSAMVLLLPTDDPMSEVLVPWGIEAKTDEIIVHDPAAAGARRSNDLVEMALQSSQFVFKLNDYGNHPIATPLQGLDFLTAAPSPVVAVGAPKDITVTPLLPIPQTPHSWASSDVADVRTGQHKMVFNPKADPDAGRPTGDVENTPATPLYTAAAAEKQGGGRLIVVGSFQFAINDLVTLADKDMLENHGLTVARLPGNGDFLVNSVLWLANRDDLLQISPHALQMARIVDMSPTERAMLGIGLLTAGIPAIIVMIGILVFIRRRD